MQDMFHFASSIMISSRMPLDIRNHVFAFLSTDADTCNILLVQVTVIIGQEAQVARMAPVTIPNFRY
jgi:hypothetical protein